VLHTDRVHGDDPDLARERPASALTRRHPDPANPIASHRFDTDRPGRRRVECRPTRIASGASRAGNRLPAHSPLRETNVREALTERRSGALDFAALSRVVSAHSAVWQVLACWPTGLSPTARKPRGCRWARALTVIVTECMHSGADCWCARRDSVSHVGGLPDAPALERCDTRCARAGASNTTVGSSSAVELYNS
jgi:hypothetical protein